MDRKPILLAPLSVGLVYLFFAGMAFLRAPSIDGLWVFLAVGFVVVAAFVVFAPAGALLLRLYPSSSGPPLRVCVWVGIIAALAAAVVIELPEPDFLRWRYYVIAGLAGAVWGGAFHRLSSEEGG